MMSLVDSVMNKHALFLLIIDSDFDVDLLLSALWVSCASAATFLFSISLVPSLTLSPSCGSPDHQRLVRAPEPAVTSS